MGLRILAHCRVHGFLGKLHRNIQVVTINFLSAFKRAKSSNLLAPVITSALVSIIHTYPNVEEEKNFFGRSFFALELSRLIHLNFANGVS